MRHFISNVPLRFRIGFAVFLPLAVLVAICVHQVASKLAQVRAFDQLCDLIEVAPTVSGLIHDLQKERGMSAGFTGSKGAKFADTLPVQRQDTDKALQAARTSLAAAASDSSAFGASIANAERALGRLADVRARISRLELPVKDVADYYTGTISDLFGIIDQLGIASVDADVSRAIVAYMALLRAKEAAGLERAMGSVGFGAGAFEHAVYVRFLTMIARQETYLEQFKQLAAEADRQFLATTVSGPAVDDVARMQRIAVDSPRTGSIDGIQADDWFKQITVKIDLMRKVEEHETIGLRQLAGELRSKAQTQYMAFLIGSIVITLLTIAFAVAMARSVTAPMASVVAIIRRLSQGDTTVNVNGADRGDEIGAIARALQVFRDNALEKERLEAERQATEARNLAERKAAIMDMANRIESETKESVQHVENEARGMAAVSEEMSRLTDTTGHNAAGVAAAAEEMLRIAETVAAAAEELSASSEDIRRQASSVGEISETAAVESQRATETIASLLDAAANIGGVISLIKEIAEKTHLLALNATIEAARAGEAGRGFAVVAAEVKMLADQTAKATDQIGEQVGGIRTVSNQCSEAINQVGRVIQQVAQIATDVVNAVEQQRAATQEISGSMQQNALSSREVTERVTEVSTAARASSDLAGRVQTASQTLHTSVGGLRETINQIVHSTSDSDRRAHPRQESHQEVTVLARGVTHAGHLKDISEDGACVIVEGTFAPGGRVTLRLAEENRPVSAQVVAYHAEAQRLHLKFDDVYRARPAGSAPASNTQDGDLSIAA